jgi:hypothetical protein
VPSYTVGYIDVYRNGVKLGTADFTATSGTSVVLASGATAGDLVETISFFVSSVLNAIPAVANAVTTSYINDGAVTTAKITDANVTQAKLASGVAGNGPAFSAFQSSTQNIAHNSNTKVIFQTESYDTNNNFDPTTNYRFTPTVAGYYNFYAQLNYGMTSNAYIMLYKNGSLANYGPIGIGWAGIAGVTAIVSATIYMNGSTDYVEIYAYQATGSSQATTALASTTFFTGFLARAA